MGVFKKILLPAVLILAVAAVNMGLNYALIPYSYVRIMMHQIETQEYDTLFLGTSHGLNGISPKVIEEKTGNSAMNQPVPWRRIPQGRLLLLKAGLQKEQPQDGSI